MQLESDITDIARSSAPERDTARHSLTIKQASELFAALGAPRAPRSVQRFCDAGYLDCVRVRGAKGDQYFINRASVERYAEELKQIEAIATIGVEARQSAPIREHVEEPRATPSRAQEPQQPDDSAAIIKRLEDENLNLHIDNKAKEQIISMFNADRREMNERLQDISYRLGAAESRVAQLEAPKVSEDAARRSAPERATETAITVIDLKPEEPSIKPTVASGEDALPPDAARGSFLQRMFGK